jgi:predicted negative regulator of RcsB-dependent stress response
MHKAKGDELVKLNNHESAIISYNKAIQVDENEYAISNKVLCLNKIKQHSMGCE